MSGAPAAPSRHPPGPTVPTAPPPARDGGRRLGVVPDRPETADEVPDAELLRRHVEGDPEAFTRLVTRHQDRLWAVALRTMRDPEDAADALQDAYLSAFRRADTFRGDAAVTTWLHRVVVNACLDRLRAQRSRAADPLPEGLDRDADLGVAPADPVEAAEDRETVAAALARLNPDQRAALVLVDMQGYSVEEAAAVLGCAPGTVKSRCARGRTRLAPLLAGVRATPAGDG